jgi:hypothetical protein
MNNLSIRVIPICYSILAYYGHSKIIFTCLFEDPNDSYMVYMNKDALFKIVIMFSALSMNIIYIGMFLSIKRNDCIV